MKSHIPNKEGHVPEEAGRNLTKRIVPENPVGLRKKLVLGTVISVGLILGFVVIVALSHKPKMKGLSDSSTDKGLTSEAVRALPEDYSKIPKPKPTKAPTPVPSTETISSVVDDNGDAAVIKILKEYELQRLRRSLKARDADVLYTDINLRDSSQQGQLLLNNQAGPSDPNSMIIATQSARDDANRQDDKRSFIKESRADATTLFQSIKKPTSPYQILPGTVIPGVLLTGINSDLPGQISGQVSQNVFDSAIGRHLLIPQGTKVIGEYDSRVSYGQERVLIVWTRLIFPNGKSLSLEGMPGVDLSGYAGLSDQVNNHYGKIITGVIFGSVLGAGAQVARGSNRNIDPAFGQLALEGSAQNINQAGQEITRKNINIQPTLEIRPGFRFNVFVTRDITLEPYI